MSVSKNRLLSYLYIAIIAFLSLAIFSNTTSPFYTEQNMSDSGLFQIIGKYWAHGYLPYVGLWDQKGPYTFFCNCLGYMLTGTPTGVFIVQWVCLTATLVIMYLILSYGFNKLLSCILLLIPLASFSANISGGDCVEEFELPFLSLAYLCVCRWLWTDKDKKNDHPAWYAMTYGIVLGLSLMSRLTNALGLCGAVAVIGIWLIVERKWHSLILNIFSFLVGFAIVTVPFILYFYSKGVLYDMWYGTLLFNFDYTEVASTGSLSIKDIVMMFINYLDTFLLLFAALMIFAFDRRRWLSAFTWLMVALFSFSWLLSGHRYAHYGVVSLPLVAVALVELRSTMVHSKVKLCRTISIAAVMGYAFVTAISCYRGYSLKVYTDESLASMQSFMKDVPSSYKKSFVCYNIGPGYYLYNDIRPACRFFTFQDWHAANSKTLKSMMVHSFEQSNVKWILTSGEPKVISKMLHDKYYVYKNSGNLTLYREQ